MITLTRRSALVILTFLLCLSPAIARADRIVAVGDIHGEYKGLVSILQAAGVIDAKLHWSGGTTRFIQTGDFLDRGVDVRNVMDLLMRLEKEAKKRRGEATILIGNHEVMNLTGYVRDVNPGAYAAFADKKSEKRRRDGYKRHLKVLEEHSKRYGQTLSPKAEAEWVSAYPLGFIEYQTALGPGGKYGRWLRARSTLTQKDGIVFLHGGLSPTRASSTLKEINERVRLELTAFDRIKAYLVEQNLIVPFATLDDIQHVVSLELAQRAARGNLDPSDDLGRVVDVARGIERWSLYQNDGPLWFRGFAHWSDAEGEPLAADLLKAFGAKHFVVGHSIPSDPSRILPRFGGKVFLIDTAMLRGLVQGGRASALEIDSGRFTAIYGNERVVLLDKRSEVHAGAPSARMARSNGIHLMAWGSAERESSPVRPWLGPRGKPLPFQTYAEVEQFLRASRFVSANRKRLYGITKPRKVLVENGRVRANAVFRSSHVEKENAYWEDGNFTEYLLDSYRAEVAAYELGLLLGVDNIPPTVLWKLKGETGALQIFIENAGEISDNYQPKDPVRWSHRMEMIQVFDGLVQNLDRHAGNLLVDSGGNLWMIDHTRSFGRGKNIHNAGKIRQCDRRVWERLKALDAETVRARLSPYLGPKEIDALLVRKHELIRLLQSKIDAEGEERILFTFGEETPLPSPVTRQSMPERGILLAGRNAAAWSGDERYVYAQQAPAVPLPAVEEKPWLGPDGEPLPFASEDEILEFLRNAEMIKSFDIPVGITHPKKVLLEMNGVRAHAVFRDINVEHQKVRLDDGKFYLFLRDSYRSEVAAYRLGKLLGIDTIPPVVERRLFGRDGSLQMWVENAMTEAKRKEKELRPPEADRWRRQLHTILIFDNLVNNADRNMGNMLIDADWKVWMIDHTRSFGREQRLLTAKKISLCPRRVWERLNSLDDKTIRDAMKPYMGPFDIASLLKRRRLMIELLKKRIAAEGESNVLFDEDDAAGEPVAPSPTSHRGLEPWPQPPLRTIEYAVPLVSLADGMLRIEEGPGLQGQR